MKNKIALEKRRRKIYTAKGELGAGMTYVILAILVIITGGSLMTGNIIPYSNPAGGQPVITLPVQNKPAKDDLQLYTFPGVTYTPTPSPTPTPTPTPKPKPKDDDDGGDKKPGDGDDGGSAR